MNSIRRYYSDSYTIRFQAQIVERVKENGRTALILDQTYFYPTSGGQPHDRGKLGNATVTDVSIRESDGAILHWLDNDNEIWFDAVDGEIDWTRRFDHMQQHTGQHILSQAFIQVAEAETVGFHLSDNRITIDLNVDTLPPEQINRAEFLANQIIWQNRPIHIREVTVEQAQKLPVRKIPPNQNGKLRLIEIEKFDLTACGGTHVTATGAVGSIKIIKTERHRGKLRVEFCCGQRALLDYRYKNEVTADLSSLLTTGTAELVTNVQKLLDENKSMRRKIKQQQDALLAFRAESLLKSGLTKQKVTIISRVFDDEDMDAGQLRTLANLVLEKSNQSVIMLGIAGSKTNILFSRSEDVPGQMNELLKTTLQVLASVSGGGTAVTAQGGGAANDKERVEQAIARAQKQLLGQIR